MPKKLSHTAEEEGAAAGTKSGKVTASERAGLSLPVCKLRDFLKQRAPDRTHLSAEAPVFLAGVLESLVDEMLDMAHNDARERKRVGIDALSVERVMQMDSELSEFFKGAFVVNTPSPPIRSAAYGLPSHLKKTERRAKKRHAAAAKKASVAAATQKAAKGKGKGKKDGK